LRSGFFDVLKKAMNTQETILLEDTYQLPTYRKYPVALIQGSGCYVWDAEGRRYLDFYGGHCVTLLGHCPPRVVVAIKQQAEQLLFYSNVVYSPIRARAAALLAEMAPEGLRHVFFCNSGTEANETALKLARTYTGKAGLIALVGGFHGRTLGSLAATEPIGYRKPYLAILPPTHFVPLGDLEAVEALLAQHKDIAAIILEPIQSMAGIYEAPADYYCALRALCDRYGVLLIFDEVQTGVGRTGTFSICEQYGMRPDLITLAKSLGSGVPVGAVLVSDAIAASVQYGDQGTTFGGGMLAMAAVTATLETLRDEDLMKRAPQIFARIRDGVADHVVAIRGRGCLIGLELDRPAAPVLNQLREAGILAGNASHPNVIRLMPPLNTPDEAIEMFIDTFLRVLNPVNQPQTSTA
jgi:acetylornithine/N-succinyldiaminopimelate aminotransferase